MKKITLLFFLLNATLLLAQKEISGVVKDKTGTPLPGVNILEKGTSNGISTDVDGAYKLTVKEGATIVFSYIGYNTVTKVANSSIINVDLQEEGSQNLNEVIVTGSRTASRSNTTSALPIDVLTAKDLNSTGQATFDKALQYRIPSFNTVQTPVNDATSLLDPYEIRNMGPSRTLILINGKRKNLSSLLYTQTSPGRGETGADISAIPTDAIERVEILRDGASAQYGSDAIAGVMNIILKKNTNYGSVTVRSGITSEGDGEMLGVSMNNGSTVGDKGFVNYTVDFSKVELANRPGVVSAEAEANPVTGFGAPLAEVQAFLATHPDAGNINGSPETAAAKFLVNGGINYTDETQLYYNAAYVYKKVNSFANYRTPYWRTLADDPYLDDFFGDGTPESYQGYVPTFEGDLNDYNATLGYKSTMNGWVTDVSATIGGNSQTYTVNNSQNRSFILNPSGTGQLYRENSPIYFKPGGTSFNNLIGNIDISKPITEKISIAFGTEFRSENFTIKPGDAASYEGSGADSFQGNTPANSGSFNRYNIGVYLDMSYDITDDFLVNGTVRYEDYSDFGNTTVWKISSRYNLLDDKVTLRGSYSTGFRAPTLHQIYTQKSQSTFEAGGAIVITGLINNVSTAARQNGIPKLDAEKSKNLTFGVGAKPIKNLNITLDYYDITVSDRIVLGNLIDFGVDDPTNDDPNYKLPTGSEQSFFLNAMDTRTSGLDFVANYTNIGIGPGKLGVNVSGNYTFVNERVGAVNNPASIANLQGPLAGQSVLDDTQESLMFTSRPKFKYIIGGDYEIGKFDFALNGTVFGPTEFNNAGMSDDLKIKFGTKLVTDLGITYSATEKLTIALNINNLFNVLPEWGFKAENQAGQDLINDPVGIREQFDLITFNGRYSQMSYDGYQFSQLGTMMNLSLNYKF